MTSRLSTRLMNICVAALCRARRLDMAELALVDGIRIGYIPDVVTYNTLVYAYCRLVGVDEAYSVVSRMRDMGLKPDVVTYNSLITGAARRRRLSRSLDLFEEMHHAGLRPDLWTYNNLLHCLFNSGHPDLAFRVLAAMETANLVPSSTTYNILINGLCKSGNAPSALALFRRLQRDGGNPRGLVAYNILIDGLCKCGRVQEARSLFRELVGSGIVPNAVTYTTMMKSYFRSGRFEDGFRMLDEIQIEGSRLDPFAYCTAIGALIKIGKIEEASGFLEEMHRHCGGCQDTVCNNTRINLCFKQGKVDVALDLLNRVEEIDDYTVSILVDGLCKNDRLPDAYHLLKHTATTSSQPNLVPYNCFIQALCREGKAETVDFAMTLFNALETKDSFTYTALLRGLSRIGRFLEANAVMVAALREGVQLPRSARRLVLAGLRSLRYKTHARKLRWEIVKAKFRLP